VCGVTFERKVFVVPVVGKCTGDVYTSKGALAILIHASDVGERVSAWEYPTGGRVCTGEELSRSWPLWSALLLYSPVGIFVYVG
jgi:hypothetical protein